jgi:hypothetical protein
MPVRIHTASSLADELGVTGMSITRAIRRHVITPDFTTGRTLLFLPRRVSQLREALGITGGLT